jgi:hypothetical protein
MDTSVLSGRLGRCLLIVGFVVAVGGGAAYSRAADNRSATEPQPTNENGILIYENGAKPPIPKDLKMDHGVLSPYGFLIVTVKDESGKEKHAWLAASEDDFRKAEAKRRGIKPEQVEKRKFGEKAEFWCGGVPAPSCHGGCNGGNCAAASNPGPSPYWYCICR